MGRKELRGKKLRGNIFFPRTLPRSGKKKHKSFSLNSFMFFFFHEAEKKTHKFFFSVTSFMFLFFNKAGNRLREKKNIAKIHPSIFLEAFAKIMIFSREKKNPPPPFDSLQNKIYYLFQK